MKITEVVAAIPYHREKQKFLVMRRAESMEVNPGLWNFPSGKVEDEKPERAALRELREETGMTGEILRSGESFEVEADGNFRVYPFLVLVESDEVEMNSEHTEYRWIEPEELEDLETVKGLRKDLESVGVI